MIPIIEDQLPEANKLQPILYPTVTSQQLNNIKNCDKIKNDLESSISSSLELETYNFENGESFKGKIANGILIKGKYMWENGQIYQGSFNSLNQFNGRGLITFKDLSTLSGNFTNNELIKRAIYKTKDKTMEGEFYKNNLHGNFIIYSNDFNENKNIKNIDNNGDNNSEENINNNNIYKYKCVCGYYIGKKHGKFYLDTNWNKYHFIINGNYKKGKKHGEFIIKETNFHIYSMKGEYDNDKRNGKFEITDFNGESIEKSYDQGFEKPIYIGEKIEQKNCLIEKEEFEINCVTLIENIENKIMILLGIKNKINIYLFDKNDKNDKNIVFLKQIEVFFIGEVNDILETVDKEILICSSEAKIILIKLNLDAIKTFSTNTTALNTINPDYEIIQEFEGLDESKSKSIFVLLELKNSWIISGDCENIIIWEKKIEENDNNNIINENDLEIEIELDKEENAMLEIKYKFQKNFKTTHTFSILEIKDNFIVSPQPDSKSILFINIMSNDIFKELKINKLISNCKNVMSMINEHLLVVGFEGIIVININDFEIKKFISIEQKINMIYPYNNDTFLCFAKNKICHYQNKWIMLQYIYYQQRKKIEIVSKLEKEKFKGYVNRMIVKKMGNEIFVFAVGKDESNENDKGKMIVLY